jgi:hypothetical protein
MAVLAIESTTVKDDLVTVEAIIGDAGLISRGTRWTPPEYAPALCRAVFYLDEEEHIPTCEDGFCSYLDSLDLDWDLIPVDDSDYDLD